MMASGNQKKNDAPARAKQPKPEITPVGLFLALLHNNLRWSIDGVLLAGAMVQLFFFLILLSTFVSFAPPGTGGVFGQQSNPLAETQVAPAPAKPREMVSVPVAVFVVFSAALAGTALYHRRRFPPRMLRILGYITLPGNIFCVVACVKGVWALLK